MSDLISAASLMLAAIGVLYGVWYPEIRRASEVDTPNHLEDAGRERAQVAEALQHRARPLFWSAAVLALLLIPDTIRILAGSLEHWMETGILAPLDYDATQAALLAIVTFLIVFALHLRRQVRALKNKRNELKAQ